MRDGTPRAEGTGRRHPVLPSTGSSRPPRARSRPRSWRIVWVSTPTPCASTWSACARSGSSTSRPCTAAPSGRPQHLYFLADGAPGLGFDPPAHALFAGLLGALAERVGADAGRGRRDRPRLGCRSRAPHPVTGSCLPALETELHGLGFEPAVGPGDGTSEGGARIEFLHCPFRELAEAYPELVCNLHRGLCEGVVAPGGRGKSRGVRDVVRPGAVPRDRGHRRTRPESSSDCTTQRGRTRCRCSPSPMPARCSS